MRPVRALAHGCTFGYTRAVRTVLFQGCPSEAGCAADRASVLEDLSLAHAASLPDLNHRFERPVCAGPPRMGLPALALFGGHRSPAGPSVRV